MYHQILPHLSPYDPAISIFIYSVRKQQKKLSVVYLPDKENYAKNNLYVFQRK